MSAHQARLALAELQKMMMETLYGSEPDAALLGQVRPREGLSAASLLTIYRRATTATLVQALRVSYPVVERLVGAGFFAAATSAYVAETPSRSGDLERYGADFARFLDRYRPAASLPYLADVARLERLLAQLLRAPFSRALDRTTLAALSAADLPCLRLALSPRSALFCSRYPAFDIWRENRDQQYEPASISLDSGETRLLLVAGKSVAAHSLTAAEHLFFECIRYGETLENAVDSAVGHDPSLDFADVLKKAIEWQCLSTIETTTAAA